MAGTSVSDFNFVDSMFADVYVYRKDSLICSNKYAFIRIILTADINLDSSILKVGDLVKLRCVLKENTVLENSYFSPDSGYYSFKVLAPVMTGVENANQNSEFSFGVFPYPFNSSTKIAFQLFHQRIVNIEIYNMLGKKVKNIINSRLLPGKYSFIWDSKDDNGDMLPSGISFIRLNSDILSQTLKIVLLK